MLLFMCGLGGGGGLSCGGGGGGGVEVVVVTVQQSLAPRLLMFQTRLMPAL